jgi:catechol 2,3-dioxygenase-like lactoylglutathione lyase family enzyme
MSGLASVIEVTVASRDVERQVRFCREAFQLEPLARDAGAVVLGVPGSECGRLRLVAASSDPGLPEPKVWETGLRVLGIYSRDVPRTEQLVTAAGGTPKPFMRFEIPSMGGYSEGSVRGPDDLIWFYPCPARPLPSPAFAADAGRLHSELHYVAITLPDVAPALEFFAGAGGMTVVMDQETTEDWACDLIGLPHGTSMRMACLAGSDLAPTRLMLTAFSNTTRATTDPARTVGIRRMTFGADPAALQQRLVKAGATVLGDGLLRGPAGVEIELRKPTTMTT